jgi:hypothetical protein
MCDAVLQRIAGSSAVVLTRHFHGGGNRDEVTVKLSQWLTPRSSALERAVGRAAPEMIDSRRFRDHFLE